MDFSQLPDEIREKLAELELELSEGEKTKCQTNQQINNFHEKASTDIEQKRGGGLPDSS